MSTSFYIHMGIIVTLAAFNLQQAYTQKPSKGRTLSLWINGSAIALIAIALTIALVTGG